MTELVFSIDELCSATRGEIYNRPDSLINVEAILTDSRGDCSDALFIALRGDIFDGHSFLKQAYDAGSVLLCVDRAYYDSNSDSEFPLLVVEDTTRAYQDVARFHRRRLGTKIVAITGSSGKTSAKEIMHSVLVDEYGENHVYSTIANTNNHIGVPLNLLNLRANHKVAVIEMGSNHLGEIEALSRTAEPDIAIITSVGNCHLEFFKTVENVAHEKGSIFKHLVNGGAAIIPGNSEYRSILEKCAGDAKTLIVGEDVVGDYRGGTLFGGNFDLSFKNGEKAHVDWPIQGEHQMLNALSVVLAAEELGLSHATIVSGLSKSKLAGMRMRIREHSGVNWVNDAYNANPDSMIAGLAWLAEFVDQNSLILVLGDMLELGDVSNEKHLEVIKCARKTFPRARIFAVGPDMSKAVSELGDRGIVPATDSLSAVELVRSAAQSGDIVYLKASRGIKLEQIEPDTF